MTKRNLIAICLMMAATSVQAETINYKCIAGAMQAVNSDIYYDLSNQQIDEMIQDTTAIGHELAAYLMTNKCSAAQSGQN